MVDQFIDDLSSGLISDAFVSSIANAVIYNGGCIHHADDISVSYWDGDNVISYDINNVERFIDCIVPSLIQLEEYELCDSLINIKKNRNMKKMTVFYADWCGPCKIYKGIYDRFLQNNPDVVLERVDIETNKVLTEQYGVRSVPTTVFSTENGNTKSITGVVQALELEKIFR